MNRIGMIDWGIGGLGVYKELVSNSPRFSCVYISDSGFTPYGKSSKLKLIRRLNQIVDFLRRQDVKTLIIACNAASTVLDDLKKQNSDIRFFGMLEAGQKVLRQSRKKNMIVLGGRRTIQSQYFQKHFSKPKFQMQALVAQPLSALIEKGKQGSKLFEMHVQDLVKKSKFKADVVLLACTHYPAAQDCFFKNYPGTQILDPAKALVEDFKKIKYDSGISKFLTTGNVGAAKSSAAKAFNLKIKAFKKIKATDLY